MMLLTIDILYFLLIIVFLVMGSAIVFHLLYYKINRRVSGVMFLIFTVGALSLLISNFILFWQVDWRQIFSNLNF